MSLTAERAYLPETVICKMPVPAYTGTGIFLMFRYKQQILLFVKLRIECIEVPAVQLFLDNSQAFAEALVVYDLSLP